MVQERVHELVSPLSSEQIWQRPFPYGNSIGNLILHLTGNLNYYIGAQIAGTGYIRQRDLEFSDGGKPKGELLKLSDHIVLTTSSGYEGYLSEATVNVTTGHIVSEHPVEVKLLNGWLNSNRLEVMENGDLIRFGGGVELNLTPDKSGSLAPSAPAQPPVQASARGSIAP